MKLIFFSLLLLPYTLCLSINHINLETDSTTDTTNYWVDSVFNTLSKEEKIAQLIMIDAYSNKDDKHQYEIEHLIKKYNIGGIIFFQGTAEKQAKLTNRYQSLAKTPIMIAMDAEWGLAMRLDNIQPFPRQMMLGAIENNGLIYDMGAEVARQCRRLGVHVNFAPVVDINNNPNNPVINSRSFGEDKKNVLKKSYAYMQGMIDNRLIVSAKHFPGHGDTDKDSHHDLPVIKHTLKHLEQNEMFPYEHLIKLGLNGIMVAHLQVEALDNRPHRPSSISKPTITDLLKNKLGFNGLIFTDALNMQGVAAYYPPGRVEVEAFKAGSDILLYPGDPEVAIKTLIKAVECGEIKQSEVDNRCKRVLAAKYWLGLDKQKLVKTENLIKDLNHKKVDELNHWFAREALTCIKNKNQTLPFKNSDLNDIAVVTIGTEETNMFHLRLTDYADPDFFYLSKEASDPRIQAVLMQLKNYKNIILAVQSTSNSPYKKYGITESVKTVINKISALNNSILIYFGNPYALERFNGIENYNSIIVTYHDNEYTRDYAAQAIMGGIHINGKLPVSSCGYKAGTSIQIEKCRLGFVHPDMVMSDETILSKIEEIATEAINERATPGCVVLAARNGNVFYQEAFGYHTYKQNIHVSIHDLYDLASITKIAATALGLMKQYDQQLLDLNKSIGDYLQLSDTSQPSGVKLIDALTHQGRLKAWYPFYTEMIDSAGNWESNFFSSSHSKNYTTEIANKVYGSQATRDTLYKILDTLPLREKEGYLYSDISYYYTYQIISKISGIPFAEFITETFYKPIHASTLVFNPLKKFPKRKIVPTEKDTVFRKQLLHGYVHDPGAALLGGICGHAGLFGNALDLAKIGQLLLFKGSYGGQQFISPKTIEYFTTSHFKNKDNRRAIAFDKPEYRKNYIGPTFWGIPLTSYGHSGFTGTYLWCDPESGLLYIFLSNRIHPNADNTLLIKHDVRTRIHEVLYESINPKDEL